LRFAMTSPPSGCEEDLHLQAVNHARRTRDWARLAAMLGRWPGLLATLRFRCLHATSTPAKTL
jgi:hypothetical protein